MAFTKITNADLKSRGCTTLPNQPAISAQALKEEFDAPAKEVVAPKVNNLIDELEATTSAASLGAVAPTGYTGNTIQLILDALGSAVKNLEASQVGATPPSGQTGDDVQTLINSLWAAIQVLQGSSHTHSNKSLLDSYTQTESDLADAVASKHTHSNKSVLDKLSEDASGNPTYDGSTIPTSGHTGGLQNFITSSFQTPTDGVNGDIDLSYNNLVAPSNDTFRRTFRKEDGSWKRLRPYAYGTDQEITAVFSEGEQDGDLAIENDGDKITKISQYISDPLGVSGDWLELSVTTSDTDITAGTTPLNDGAIYLVYE